MRAKFIVLVLIISVVVLGCGQKEEVATTLGGTSFIGGNEGIGISFISGAPPAEVFDNGKLPFSINLQIENKGEWDILNPQDFTITISGIDPSDFNNPDIRQDSPQPLIATKRDTQGNLIPGTVASMIFPGFSYLGNLAGDAQFTIRASACYSYGTKGVTKICVRDDLLSLEQGVCVVNGDKGVENSGAPVKVIEVKEAALASDKLQLTFKIKKTEQDGSLFQLGTECSTNLQNRDIVKVTVNTGISGTDCQGFTDEIGNPQRGNWGYVNLFSGERIISCIQEVSSVSGDFEKIIDFTLEYDYRQSIEQSILVKHVG